MPQAGYRSGIDFENQDEAREYAKRVGVEYRFGCLSEKRGDSCHLLGDFLEAAENKPLQAYKVYRDNCRERSWAASCEKFGRYHLQGGVEGVKKDLVAAEAAMRKACDGDYRIGCWRLGQILMVSTPQRDQPQPSEAMKVWTKCCEAGEGDCCWSLNSNYLGLGTVREARPPNAPDDWTPSGEKREPLVPVDYAKALQAGLRGCNDLHHWQSCVNLSHMYKRGDGVGKSEAKAREFKEKAADITHSVRTGKPLKLFTG